MYWMKITNIKELKEKIQTYDIIIFDLDDTIYAQNCMTHQKRIRREYLSKIIKMK